MSLYYNDSSGKLGNLPSTNFYNGNISAISWNNGGQGNQAYAFKYDDISRLTAANYGVGSSFSAKDAYTVNGISYDANGNIKSLNRNEKDLKTNAILDIDRLTYSYDGNQLKAVEDHSQSDAAAVSIGDVRGFMNGATLSHEYHYDANGNMTKDLNKGITEIKYNILNLPENINISGKDIRYVYSAAGEKLQNIVGGKKIAYNGGFVYEKTSGDEFILKYIFNSEGRYVIGDTVDSYEYNLTDHLGNVRAVVDANGDVIQQSNYYPFGGVFAKSGSVDNKYLYNGKEKQELTGWLDYGARMYSADLGRWFSPDPLGQFHNPYIYAANNPILQIDTDGQWSVSIHYNMTYKQMRNLGYSKEYADKVAYMSSTYADQPQPWLLNPLLGTGRIQKYGRFGVQYEKGPTANSQNNDGNSWRHAMMSDSEAKQGKTYEWAINRTVDKAWDSILDGAANNDAGMLGVGMHAIQDIEAHEGASYSEHLGFKTNFFSALKMCLHDVFGSKTESNINTIGMGVIVGIITGNKNVINNSKNNDGIVNITLTKAAINISSLKKIINGILNSNYKGPVTVTIQ